MTDKLEQRYRILPHQYLSDGTEYLLLVEEYLNADGEVVSSTRRALTVDAFRTLLVAVEEARNYVKL